MNETDEIGFWETATDEQIEALAEKAKYQEMHDNGYA